MGDVDKKEKKIEDEEIKLDFKDKIGTLGNVLLIIFVILILSTGALIYYLLHSEKDNYDKNNNEVVDTMAENEEQPETIANIIDSALSDITNSSDQTQNSDNKKIMNEKLIVLYNGLILDTSKMDEIELKYIDEHSEEKDKFVITYSNYENYSLKNTSLGTLSEPVYEGLLQIENVSKIAISEDYNAIPRNIKVVNTIPTIILENNSYMKEYDTVKTLIVDLDGNGINEYILVLANKTTGFSKITLVDSKGTQVADLASIEKNKWGTATNTDTGYYLSINNVEIIDIDNDNIMEILIEIPHYEGPPSISLLKYKNGELQGKKGIKCSLMP